MIDVDRILTGKIAHMLRSYAKTIKDETYCCSLCPYGDATDCEAALENDISELQKLVDNYVGAKLDQIRYEMLEAEQCYQTAEDLRRLSQFANMRSNIYERSKA